MNSHILTSLEILTVISTSLQVIVIVFASFFYHKLPKEKRVIWKWFWLSLVLILGRRVIAVGRSMSTSLPTLELEYFITTLVSVCWIIFIYKYLFRVTEKKNSKKEG